LEAFAAFGRFLVSSCVVTLLERAHYTFIRVRGSYSDFRIPPTVPEGHKPKNATGKQLAGGRLQRRQRYLELGVRRDLAKRIGLMSLKVALSRGIAGEPQMMLEKTPAGK
jgi:hypothetical protein